MSIVIPKNELNEFSLPRVCVATGQPSQVTFQKVQFQYAPKWLLIFALAPLLYLILYLLLRKTASGTLPFSEAGWNAVKAARRKVFTSGMVLFGGVVGGAALAEFNGDVGTVMRVTAAVVGLIALVVTSLQFRRVYPVVTLIDDRTVTLKLPSLEAEQLIRAHLQAGAKAP